MEGDAAIEGGQLAPLLGSRSGSGSPAPDASLLRRLYAGHALARWGARMWEFSVGLYMIRIWPGSLLFTAIYGVVESGSIAVFGPMVGTLVDKLTYLQVLGLWLLVQSLSFIIAGASVTALLIYDDLKATSFPVFMALVIVTNVSGALAALSTLAGTILIEREWVVVMSCGHPPALLTGINSVVRRIDLSCKLLAPVFSGLVFSFVSAQASAVALALWNVASVGLEYWLFVSVYNGVPALAAENGRDKADGAALDYTLLGVVGGLHEAGRGASRARSRLPLLHRPEASYLKLCGTLITEQLKDDEHLRKLQSCSFGTLMTATLDWKGIPAYVISLARGFSAIVGIGATLLYPVVHSWVSTLRTGLWSIWMQWCCLLVCVASIWAGSSLASAWMLMAGVAASRLGLWMFDLAVMQLMQDSVPEHERCVVGGVQNSLQSVFDLLTYIMGIIISDPRDFSQLIVLSSFLVTCAAAMYTLHVYRVRKHLFHFDKILAKISW
ncbi:Solute carrier family 40 member 1 [Dichanthelium oligosanthes]|uniref:Solute carrier family 40 member n=1 Tax=Dichanthelium oligosanthes TaxID=888268 RepID=A0A1E5VWY2_9POAL|nr:Solute carrier family 40 member 1 [Dichanthelium oligosanthes]